MGEGVSVEEIGGTFHAKTLAGEYEVSVVYDPKSFPPMAEAAFLKGNKPEEIIRLEAESLGGDAETVKSSLEEAALRFADLIKRGFSPAQIQEGILNESMGE